MKRTTFMGHQDIQTIMIYAHYSSGLRMPEEGLEPPKSGGG